MWSQLLYFSWWAINGLAAAYFSKDLEREIWIWLLLVGFHVANGTVAIALTFLKNLDSLSYLAPSLLLLASLIGFSLSTVGGPSVAGFIYTLWTMVLTLLGIIIFGVCRFLIRRRVKQQIHDEMLTKMVFTPLDTETAEALTKGEEAGARALMRLALNNMDESPPPPTKRP